MDKVPRRTALKSTAETFKARTGSAIRSTLADFKFTPLSVKSDMVRDKANLFAHALIQLWTSKKSNEETNFIACYELSLSKTIPQLSECNLPPTVDDFHLISATLINQYYFSRGVAQNLGTLTLLNLLMGSSLSSSSLGLAMSPATGHYFFTQKFSPFWLDYFTSDRECDLFSSPNFNQKLDGFIEPKHALWWDVALKNKTGSRISTRELFLNEMYETALRIYLTPDLLLDEIIHKIFGQDTDQTQHNFKVYFFNKINRFKQQFLSFFSTDEIKSWHDFIDQKSTPFFYAFSEDLHQIKIAGKLTFRHISPQTASLIHINAMSLKIPRIMPHYLARVVENYSYNEAASCLSYSMIEVRRDWSVISMQFHADAWLLLNKLTSILENKRDDYDSQIKFDNQTLAFLPSFLAKSIQFHENNIACFFISEIELNGTELNDALLAVAHKFNNRFMISFLNNLNARALVTETEVPSSPSFFRQRERSISDEKLSHTSLISAGHS